MSATAAPKAKIGVIVHSIWGHQNEMAQAVFEGASSVPGCEVTLYQFEETLPQEVLTKMHAAPKPDWPVITTDAFASMDGFVFCYGTRYGRAPSQASAFFDKTGGLWAAGTMLGKVGSIVTGAGGQHGGHEATVLTSLPFFAHLESPYGIIWQPNGYAKSEISNESTIVGGSPYGASVVAGAKGTLPVTDSDKIVARYQGENLARLASTLLKGKAAIAQDKANRAGDVTGPVAAKNEPVALGAPVALANANGEQVKKDGYSVPNSNITSAPAANADATPTPAPADAPVVAPASAPVTEKPKPASTPTAKPAPKKKGGLFASCCGGDGSNLKA